MASIGADLIAYLKTITAVTDLVGTGDAARIYLNEARQDQDPPYIVIEVYQGWSAEDLTGPVGVAQNRIMVDAYATTSAGAFTLAEAIRLAPLQGYRGTAGATYIYDVSSSGGYDQGRDRGPTGSEVKRFYASRDYIVTHKEST